MAPCEEWCCKKTHCKNSLCYAIKFPVKMNFKTIFTILVCKIGLSKILVRQKLFIKQSKAFAHLSMTNNVHELYSSPTSSSFFLIEEESCNLKYQCRNRVESLQCFARRTAYLANEHSRRFFICIQKSLNWFQLWFIIYSCNAIIVRAAL